MDKRLLFSLVISIFFHLAVGGSLLKLFSPHLDGVKLTSQENETIAKSPSTTQEYVITPLDSPVSENDVAVHTVKRGESLWVIAREYRISVEALMEANSLSPQSVLKVGDTLKIPESEL